MPAYRFVHCTRAFTLFLVPAAFADHLAALPLSCHVTHLGALGGAESNAWGINADGHGVRWSQATDFPFTRAFRWAPTTPNGITGTMIDLGSLFGDSYAWGINDVGNVSGYSGLRAFVHDGAMHDIGTLGGTFSSALSTNDAGQVTGYSYRTGDAGSHAFLWSPTTSNATSGSMVDLGTLGGMPDTSPYGSFDYDINSGGQVVGYSFTTGDFDQHAFLSTAANGMVDLDSMIDSLSGRDLNVARAINDAGQIAGARYVNGQVRGFLLTPIPEP